MKPSRALVALSFVAAVAQAQAAPCDAPEFRQFDFWVGEWTVHTPDGRQAGVNVITRGYGGCVLHERYKTPGAYSGESLNTYDAGRKAWHQTWVDVGGTLLLLDGGWNGSSMVMEGSTVADGKTTKHRISWTPNADGTVRQWWQSTDAKGEWTTAFDGLYRRR